MQIHIFIILFLLIIQRIEMEGLFGLVFPDMGMLRIVFLCSTMLMNGVEHIIVGQASPTSINMFS